TCTTRPSGCGCPPPKIRVNAPKRRGLTEPPRSGNGLSPAEGCGNHVTEWLARPTFSLYSLAWLKRRTQRLGEVQDEIIIKYDVCTFFNIAVSIGNATAIRDVTALHIEPLGLVVAGMQSYSDANNTGTARRLGFRLVQQSARDPAVAKFGEHVQVLNLRNLQFDKSRISR